MTVGTCEEEFYRSNRLLLEIAGVKIEQPSPKTSAIYCGIAFNPGPRIVIKPSFAMNLTELYERVKGENNTISAKSAVTLEGKTILKDLTIDGSYRLRDFTAVGAQLTAKNYVELAEVNEKDTGAPEHLKIRGYKMLKNELISP